MPRKNQSLREKSGRNTDSQPGHKGRTLKFEDAPDVPQNLYIRRDKHYKLTNHLGECFSHPTDRRRHGENLLVGGTIADWFAETANAQMYF